MAKKEMESSLRINGYDFKNKRDFIYSGRRCCTCVPSWLQIARVKEEISAYRNANREGLQSVSIGVRFIHLVNGQEGAVSEAQRNAQLDVLNEAYSPHNIGFYVVGASVHNNSEWFRMGHRSAAERAAKRALGANQHATLNFYTAGLQSGLLGWATFPFDLAGDPEMDGVVLLYSTLPGGETAPYNLGMTAVHEVGHWLGLYHTFEPAGVCSDDGDHIPDTVDHKDPDYGTPSVGQPGCRGGTSPINNYMNYVDDVSMSEFTPGQARRMMDQVGMYRPELASSRPDAPPPVQELSFVASQKGTLAGQGDSKVFRILLPRAAKISLKGPADADFDIYVKRDAVPTTEDHDYRGISYTSNEELTVQVPDDAIYFIKVLSYKGSGEFELSITL